MGHNLTTLLPIASFLFIEIKSIMNQAKTGLEAINQKELETWVLLAKNRINFGRLPQYIPILSEANPAWLAVSIQTISGKKCTGGNVELKFPLMSVIKPFVLFNLLCELGEYAVFKTVGIEPTEKPYNSLIQLEEDKGWPRNPTINSGAIALASLLPGSSAIEKCEQLRLWLNQQANCQLSLDELMLNSVKSLPNQRNRTIARVLAESGYIKNWEIALDTYERICCLSGNIVDLANLGILLVKPPGPQWQEYALIVKALMSTCGLYEASARYAVKIGIPCKSGVSGAILGVVPGEGAIACYSPPLDKEGNSVGGLFLLELMSRELKLSVFN